jgi:ketosteroid isomerase-like protein
VEKILSYWSDDAVVYPPGVAVVSGKAAIRNYVSANLKTPFFSISWKRAQGRYLTVWRRNGGGPWKCVIDFWNDSPFAAPPIPRPTAKPAAKKK